MALYNYIYSFISKTTVGAINRIIDSWWDGVDTYWDGVDTYQI